MSFPVEVLMITLIEMPSWMLIWALLSVPLRFFGLQYEMPSPTGRVSVTRPRVWGHIHDMSPHIVDTYLQQETIQCMQWPARSP
ncbi:hypothetical protein TNCV_2348601 [Trichonephila clavipes]|uniref:Uncharacterized protein n=1 Tax=Trichonephila clavipes TaxID=2585209 RepID=A0A8X6SRS7_TRICX|nr:hypothetical protein TNCV_2348601 [Trichonephila clavipes]